MNNVVTTNGLTKYYGVIKAVDKLTLSIPEKSVFGILGPNGSGKTTTLGMLLDVINPTSGSYSWFGKKPDKETRQTIGSILETPAFYPYLSAVDNLKIVAEIKAIGYENIHEVLQITGLYDRRNSAFSTFSLGMKQRLALASALLCDPLVMILDEPTNGLDPRGIAEIRELIRDIAARGKTIILASHLLDEVQKVCTHFAVLNKGQLLHSGPVNETKLDEQRLEMAAENMTNLKTVLESFPGTKKIETTGDTITITLPGAIQIGEVSRFVFERGIFITHLVSLKKSLETQFLEILNEPA
ncbi:MAG: ATP-binding cassette domain-containing protein [Bacteroidales bacterium]|nr:ATP-binding cassette domain-containing protein [Bacteroidales bacterium]